MGSSFASFFTPLSDRLWATFFTKCDAEREICKAALDRIGEEKHKIEHIVAAKRYKNAEHEKAFTRTSFELLSKDMKEVSKLSGVWNYRIRRDARKLVDLADQRDAAGVLAVIAQLEPRLEKQTRGMTGKEVDAVHF
jgi:hypothetical protein